MDLNLGRAFQSDIRDDSVATVRSLGILGDKYVEITLGSESASELPDGATLKSQDTVDYYQIADEARETFRRANDIAKEIIDVLSQLDKAALVKNLNSAAESLSQILANAEKGPSLLHSLVYDPELPKTLDDLRAAAKSLRATAEKVESGKGGLGELIHGEKLSKALADFADAVDSARAILKEVRKRRGRRARAHLRQGRARGARPTRRRRGEAERRHGRHPRRPGHARPAHRRPERLGEPPAASQQRRGKQRPEVPHRAQRQEQPEVKTE